MDTLLKRIKALLWHSGMMAVAFLFEMLATNLTSLELPEYLFVPVGLILAQVSKHIHNVLRDN